MIALLPLTASAAAQGEVATDLSPEDRALLEQLDLLLGLRDDWELLMDWDPDEALPIPVVEPAEDTPSEPER